jgi:tetratricopeptide (TPR) repeat protein
MRKQLIILVSALTFFACTNKPDSAQKAAELEQRLVELDKEIGGARATDPTKAATFIQTAEELAALVQASKPDQYADVLLKAAGLAVTVDNPQKAVALYEKVAALPQHPKAPTALFMKAFVLENNLNDLGKAKATYEAFLQQYPNDPDFADDAQTALQMLGKSPEEIIQEFEKMQEQPQKSQ